MTAHPPFETRYEASIDYLGGKLTKLKRPEAEVVGKPSPEGLGVKIPPKPFLQTSDEYDDEEDDAHYEELSEAGLTVAAEDLSVRDFFAGLTMAAFIARTGFGHPPEKLAKDAYDCAEALCAERSHREETEEEDEF